MHTVKSIEVSGFRGTENPIRINLNRHTNFLIGRNGTGKTTLINLINSALALDHRALRSLSWSRIILKFRSDTSRRVPILEIIRTSANRSAVITFIFKGSSQDQPTQFNFPARETNLVPSPSGRMVPLRGRLREAESTLRGSLDGLYNLTWLSLARSDDRHDARDMWDEDNEPASDVHRKLEQSFTKLISYFSRLDAAVSDETQNFQKDWFLSFLSPPTNSDEESLTDINIQKEEEALRSIFHKFQMTPDSFEFKLLQYFKRLESARTRKEKNVYDSLEQVGVIYDAFRLHSLVEKWQELQELQRHTYKPKLDFIKIASDLLFKKNIAIDRSNQTRIVNDQGFTIPIESLSSGEKQILIFLSQTLLQQGMPHIFLADEPELSLHVEWQEDLVPSLLKLNPQAQVLFATHSPDIVGRYQDCVIKMEDLIKNDV